eukprot:TRINITY_DN114_c0_g1_i1.p1 TRINITY_DN114_c0_g1~~TRINITY_DN114_c0_g1_i1.p1  ORF type:complete len:255 (-),score=31.09 TRINITY_DN114_c0_g1_i1:814-1578(-)
MPGGLKRPGSSRSASRVALPSDDSIQKPSLHDSAVSKHVGMLRVANVYSTTVAVPHDLGASAVITIGTDGSMNSAFTITSSRYDSSIPGHRVELNMTSRFSGERTARIRVAMPPGVPSPSRRPAGGGVQATSSSGSTGVSSDATPADGTAIGTAVMEASMTCDSSESVFVVGAAFIDRHLGKPAPPPGVRLVEARGDGSDDGCSEWRGFDPSVPGDHGKAAAAAKEGAHPRPSTAGVTPKAALQMGSAVYSDEE